jgi:hypothetical protein
VDKTRHGESCLSLPTIDTISETNQSPAAAKLTTFQLKARTAEARPEPYYRSVHADFLRDECVSSFNLRFSDHLQDTSLCLF